MQSINNFENLTFITGKTFDEFKKNLMAIPTPCKVELWGKNPIGTFYAIVMTDRPVRTKVKSEKPD